jgi:hypothetical protein
LQIATGLRRRSVRIMHLIEVIDASIREAGNRVQ